MKQKNTYRISQKEKGQKNMNKNELTLVVKGAQLKLVRDLLGNNPLIFGEKTKSKKEMTFAGWRAVTIGGVLQEYAKPVEKVVKNKPEKAKKADDGIVPLFQSEILDKNHKPEKIGWVWLKFSGKPNAEIRAVLKENGFTWSQKWGQWLKPNFETDSASFIEEALLAMPEYKAMFA